MCLLFSIFNTWNSILAQDPWWLVCNIVSLFQNAFLHIILNRCSFFGEGTSVDILKVAGYKLSALEIEAVLLEVKAFE
jgi:acyl-CoA synthetase (AMP-forming)/AMP-acid ligase II